MLSIDLISFTMSRKIQSPRNGTGVGQSMVPQFRYKVSSALFFVIHSDALSAFGLGVDNKAKIKFRAGLNLNTFKAYIRVRVRTEPINSFNIAEGIHIFGKVIKTRLKTH